MDNKLTLTCSYCKKEALILEGKCTNCGFPYEGTQKEQSIFIGQQKLKEYQYEEAQTKIKRGIYTLFVLGVINLFYLIVLYFQYETLYSMLLFMAVSYIMLGILALRRSPMVFLLIGLGLYLSIHLLSYMVNPGSLWRGVLWKIVFLVLLLGGIYNAYLGNRLKKELNQ